MRAFGLGLLFCALAGGTACDGTPTPPPSGVGVLEDFQAAQPGCIDESRLLCPPTIERIDADADAEQAASGRITFFANPAGSWTLVRWPVSGDTAGVRRVRLRARAPAPTKVWVLAIERGRGPTGWTQLEHFGRQLQLDTEWTEHDLALADFEFRWGLEGDRRLDPGRLDGIALAPVDGSRPAVCELELVELVAGTGPLPTAQAGGFSNDLDTLVTRLRAEATDLPGAPGPADAEALARVRAACVQVRVGGPWTSRAGGVRLDGGALVLTNKHVVSSPGAIEAVTADAALHGARFLGGPDWDDRFVFSAGVDLAVLEIDGVLTAVAAPEPAPAPMIATGVALYCVTPEVRGDQVSHTVRAGRAVQLNRPGLLFATLPAEAGMSGSPICTADGRLVGVLCGRAGRFAAIVTLDRLKELADALLARRESLALQHPLGLLLEPHADGARITAVVPASAAWALGLRGNEVVTHINGVAAGDLAQVRRAVTTAPATLTLVDGRSLTLQESTK